MTDVVLGIDSSTQSTKVEARLLGTGAVVASASASHPPTTPPVSEQDPTAWWAAAAAACAQIPPQVRSQVVVAVSVAGQQHGLVLLDEAGLAVRPCQVVERHNIGRRGHRIGSCNKPRCVGGSDWVAAGRSIHDFEAGVGGTPRANKPGPSGTSPGHGFGHATT